MTIPFEFIEQVKQNERKLIADWLSKKAIAANISIIKSTTQLESEFHVGQRTAFINIGMQIERGEYKQEGKTE